MTVDLASVTKETFDPHTGSRFTMHVGAEQSLQVELLETEAIRSPPNAKRPSFVLRFRSKERSHVPQQIYTLDHDQLGTLEIFLVPLGPDAVGMIYEAIFS